MNLAARHTLFGVSVSIQEWVLFALCVALALVLAVRPDMDLAKEAILRFGYWQMWLLVLGAAYFAGSELRTGLGVGRRWWRPNRWPKVVGVVLLLGGASVFAHLHFPHRFKVLADEAVLANTSQSMHDRRIVYTAGSATQSYGVFLPADGYLDKRPYFHPFVVSLVHDLTGYRWNNSIWLNAALTPAVFLTFFVLGRRMHRRFGGLLAVGLASGIPIFGHTATGGGFETLNLLMLLVTTIGALRCWEAPTPNRFGWLVVSACMLAYCRYESALYVVPVGVVAWLALRRLVNTRLPWTLFAAPLMCVPLIWLQRMAFAEEARAFQLSVRGDAKAFSSAFLGNNLQSAWQFFFVPSSVMLSSPVLTVLGLFGAAVLAGWLWRNRAATGGARRQIGGVLALFGAATMAGVGVFLFFNYGQYGNYITQRVSLPVFGTLVLGAVWFAVSLPWRQGCHLALGAALANVFFIYLPAANDDLATRSYITQKDFDFVRRYAEGLSSTEGVFVHTYTTPAWLCMQRPCQRFDEADRDLEEIYAPLRSGQYLRILIHAIECYPGARFDESNRLPPPPWFYRIEKRRVSQRWLADGIVSNIYEIVLPRDEPAPRVSAH